MLFSKKIRNNKYILIKICVFIQLINEIVNECERDKPIKLINGQCVSQYCTKEQLKSGECSIDNDIIKRQWLNNIILFEGEKFKYFNFVISPYGDMIFDTHSYPCTTKRLFYGLKQNGRYYFKQEDTSEETPYFNLTTDSYKIDKKESINSFFISNEGNKYILSISYKDLYTELFDFENNKIYSKSSQELLGFESRSKRGNLINIDNNNTFLFGYIADPSNYSTFYTKFKLHINYDENDISIESINTDRKLEARGEMVTCFQTEKKILICFYINETIFQHYTILAYDENINPIGKEEIMYNATNRFLFFSCIHLEGEVGAFSFYKYSQYINGSDIEFPYIFFKKFTTKFEDLFSKNNYIILDKYLFYGKTTFDDFQKISNKKICYISVSNNFQIIYIVLLNIFSSIEQIKVKYYSIKAYDLYHYNIYQDLKAIIFNKFIVLGSNSCPDNDCNYEVSSGNYFTSLIIFCYPNGTDNNIDVIDYLSQNNNIKVQNLIFNLTKYLIIENNIFGYIYYGIIIQDIISKSDNINLISSVSQQSIQINTTLNKKENIKVEFINNLYDIFEYKLMFAFIITEPDYDNDELFPVQIDTRFGNDNKVLFNEQKELFIGKTFYFNVSLNQKLSIDCQDSECGVCLANNIDNCISKYYYDESEENMKCDNEEIIENLCNDITIEQDQEKSIFNSIKEDIKNYINNTIIKTKNNIFQFSTLEDQKTNDNDISSIYLGECENILKKQTQNPIKILKVDTKSEDLLSTYVHYEVYDSITGQKLDLSSCSETEIVIETPKILDNMTLTVFNTLREYGYDLFNASDPFYNDICTVYTSLNGKDMLLVDRWNDIYVPSNDQYFCQDGCIFETYNITSEKVKCNCYIKEGNEEEEIDFTLKKFIESFSSNLKNSNFLILKCYKVLFNITIFGKNYGSIIMIIILICFFIMMIIYFIKGQKKLEEFIKFMINIKKEEINSNKNDKNVKKKKQIKTTKDVHLLNKNNKNFPPKRQFRNSINIGKIYFINKPSSNKVKKEIKNISNKNIINKMNCTSTILIGNKKNLINNNNKSIDKDREKIKKNKKVINKKNNKKNTKLNDYELNNLSYLDAIQIDDRTYVNYYISLLKTKHLIIFTFFPIKDYNLVSIKISLFLLSFSIYFTANGFFFSDSTMHKIYEDIDHSYNFIYQFPKILYSTLICSATNTLLRLLSLSEKNIVSIKKVNNLKSIINKSIEVKQSLKIKFIIFYVVSYILILFFFYFISCFCAVYNNTMYILIEDTFISFGISMLYPFGLNLLPGLFRIPALKSKKKDKKVLYIVSQFISLI